jgi:Tfp pilus assembly protein PilN
LSTINLVRAEAADGRKQLLVRLVFLFLLLLPLATAIIYREQSGRLAALQRIRDDLRAGYGQLQLQVRQHEDMQALTYHLAARATLLESLQYQDDAMLALLLHLPELLPAGVRVISLQHHREGWLLEAESREHEAISQLVADLGRYLGHSGLRPLRLTALPDTAGSLQLRFALEWKAP